VLAAVATGQDFAGSLESTDLGERLAAQQAIRTGRRDMIHELMRLAAAKTAPDPTRGVEYGLPLYPELEPKHLAIELLGELRAGEAVRVLFGNLRYCNPRVRTFELLTWQHDFPAAVSLMKIGQEALPPAMARLARSEEQLERRLCLWIVKTVLGPDLARAALRIEADKEKDPAWKANLEAAIAMMDTPDWERPE
jgi:hypothetical protein